MLPSQTAACNADAGVLGCWESGCMHECTAQMLGTFSRFSIVCMASHTFGGMLSPFGFPGITLFLGFGVLTLVALALALGLALALALALTQSLALALTLARALSLGVLAGPFGLGLIAREDALQLQPEP